MPADDVTKIRSVAIVGQGGTGKTTVADALLFAAGAARPLVGRDGVDDAVGTDLPGVVVQDRHARPDAGADEQRGLSEELPPELVDGLVDGRHDARDDDAGDLGLRVARGLEEPQEEDAILVGGALTVGAQPPVPLEAVALVRADDGVGVSDVDGEEHGVSPRSPRGPSPRPLQSG